MRRHVIAVLAVLVIIGGAIAAATLWNRPPADLVGEWIATSIELDGESVLQPTDSTLPTMTIRDDGTLGFSLNAGCNTMGAPMTYRTGGGLEIGEIASTAMACPEPLMERDAGLLQALGRVDHVEVDQDSLELTGDDVFMAFTRLTG